MAYIDWWNRTGPVTLGERFGLNGIKRVALAKGVSGGWWGDWKLNYEDQMSFEEYKQSLDIDKNPSGLEKAEGGRIGFDAGGMAKLVEHVNTLKDGTVLTREYITDYISKNNIKVNVENFFNRVFPSERVKKTLKADTSFAAQYTEEQLKNIEAFGKKKYDKLDLQTQYRVRRGDDVGKLAVTQKDKYKSAYKKAYKFYKDKGVKIDDKVEEIIRKNISTNEGKFVEPKFSKLIYEGISSKLPDYTLEMLKKDLKAGKTSHQIAIEYFKANKKEVLKIFEGTTKFKQPLSVLSTAIGQAIKGNTELSKLYEKIIKDNSFKVGKDKAKYIKDIETLLPFIQEKGILVVDERGKAIKNAGDYFRYAYRTVSEPISKLFGYYETVGIEHPGGVARAVILEDANTLNRIIATIPETNTIKSKLDKYATGQAQFFKNIGDSKYIKNLNKITKKMNEEFSTPRVVTDVKKGEAVVRPMKDLSLTKPNLFKQIKGYIMQKLAAGGFNKSHFNKLAPDLQKAIKAFEGGNLIKGNKYLKAAMLAIKQKKLFSAALGPLVWGSVFDDILKQMAEGKSFPVALGSHIGLEGAQKDWQERKYTIEHLTPAHVELQDRMKILDLADKKRISLFDIATASERDKEYTGSPHEYIEWLRNRVQDPDQQLLWKERSETIKKGMKFSSEKLEERQQTYKDWKNWPPVQAVEELFKSDEERAEDREKLYYPEV